MSINQHGIVVSTARFTKYLQELAKTLTIWIENRRGRKQLPDIKLKVWKIVDDKFYMPRFLDQIVQDMQSRVTMRVPISYDDGTYNIDGRAKFTPTVQIHQPQYRDAAPTAGPTLMKNQQYIIDHCMEKYYNADALARGRASMLLDMPAGQGKTYTAAGFTHRLNVKRTLYITITKLLITQAMEDFEKAIPEFTTQQLTCSELAEQKVVTKNITFMTLASAVQCEAQYLEQFDFVIMDEIHTYCGNKTADLFWKIVTPYMLGMSGTMNDRPAYDQIYKWHIGNYVDVRTIPGVVIEKTQFSIVVHAISYYGPPEYTKHLVLDATGDMFYSYMLEQFSHDPYRNTLVCQYVNTLYQKGEYIYVFCATRAVVTEVALMLQNYLGIDIDTPELTQLMSGVSDEQVQSATKSARVIVATYQYAGTGVSIQRMTGCILYDPRKAKMRQIIARILRLGSDEKIVRHVYDIIDMNTGLKKQSAERASVYREHSARIVKSKIEYTEIEIDEHAQACSEKLMDMHETRGGDS